MEAKNITMNLKLKMIKSVNIMTVLNLSREHFVVLVRGKRAKHLPDVIDHIVQGT